MSCLAFFHLKTSVRDQNDDHASYEFFSKSPHNFDYILCDSTALYMRFVVILRMLKTKFFNSIKYLVSIYSIEFYDFVLRINIIC